LNRLRPLTSGVEQVRARQIELPGVDPLAERVDPTANEGFGRDVAGPSDEILAERVSSLQPGDVPALIGSLLAERVLNRLRPLTSGVEQVRARQITLSDVDLLAERVNRTANDGFGRDVAGPPDEILARRITTLWPSYPTRVLSASHELVP
jgi:hypothetical protein